MDKFANTIYAYCTDFIINLANLTGLSYYEINAIIFCFLYPLLFVLLIGIYWIQKKRLKKAKSIATLS